MEAQILTRSVDKPALPPGMRGELSAVANGLLRASSPPSSGKVNILLVDDRDDKLLAYQSALISLGQNLVCARSGSEALRHLLDKDFAVVVLDVFMPIMDGIETAALIRQRPRNQHTPIILVTWGSPSASQVQKGYSLGAVDYILAPIVPEVLRAKAAVFVDLSLKAEQIREQAEQIRRIEEAEHRRRLAEAVDRLDAETKRNRFFTLALDMLAITDFQGCFKQVNPSWERCLNYDEEELRSKSVLELVHPEEREAVSTVLQQLQEGTSSTYFEGRYLCKNCSWRWLGWTAAPFLAEKLIYLFARDITARKQAENEIRELNVKLQAQVFTLTEVNKELDAFNYSIAHDLRAPLRSMQGFAQVLLEDYGSELGAKGAELASRIVYSSHRLDRLLGDLLAYSRLTNAELLRLPVSLDEALSEVLASVQKDIQDKAAVLDVQGPLGFVLGHAPTVNQILANLIGNALKFVSNGQPPRIRITSTRRDNLVRLSIQDDGIGIEADYHSKIFGLFERLHSNRQYSGTGIGLALVRKGVERMGGHVGVESEPGKGSIFWVDLPALPETSNGEVELSGGRKLNDSHEAESLMPTQAI